MKTSVLLLRNAGRTRNDVRGQDKRQDLLVPIYNQMLHGLNARSYFYSRFAEKTT